MVHRLRTGSVMQQKLLPPFRQMRIDKIGSRLGKTNHIRSKKSSDNRYGYYDRIQKMACHVQRHSQRGDDKGELANLRQTKAALHSRLQRLPGKQYPQRSEQGLSGNNRQRNDNNRSGILHYHQRVYHHTYGYEKYGAEQILHRFNQTLDTLRFYRFSQNRPHNKSAECR